MAAREKVSEVVDQKSSTPSCISVVIDQVKQLLTQLPSGGLLDRQRCHSVHTSVVMNQEKQASNKEAGEVFPLKNSERVLPSS